VSKHHTPHTLTCACGHTSEISVADSLHVSDAPELREAILAGTFHVFPCPACERTHPVEKLLSYTDFPRRHWFTVVPPGAMLDRAPWLAVAREGFQKNMVQNAPPLVQGWAGEMTQRLVFGLASLREKLVAFDAGLDDHVLELLKLQIIRDFQLTLSLETYLFLVEDAGKNLIFEYGAPGTDGTTIVPMPRISYEQIASRGEAANWALAPVIREDIIVDYRLLMAGKSASAFGHRP